MSRDYKRENYLRKEIEIAHRNAKAADTMGRYAEADWWESWGRELLAEIANIEKRDEMADIPAEKCEEAHDG